MVKLKLSFVFIIMFELGFHFLYSKTLYLYKLLLRNHSIRNVQKHSEFSHCNKTLCKISHMRTLCSFLTSKYSH